MFGNTEKSDSKIYNLKVYTYGIKCKYGREIATLQRRWGTSIYCLQFLLSYPLYSSVVFVLFSVIFAMCAWRRSVFHLVNSFSCLNMTYLLLAVDQPFHVFSLALGLAGLNFVLMMIERATVFMAGNDAHFAWPSCFL